MIIIIAIAAASFVFWLYKSHPPRSDRLFSDDDTDQVLRNLFAVMPHHQQEALFHYYANFPKKAHNASSDHEAVLLERRPQRFDTVFQSGLLPSARLAKIGLLRLQMVLPQYRGQLQDVAEWDELAEAYALATQYVESLRADPKADTNLIKEYETLCSEIIEDVRQECKYRDL